MIVPIHWTPRTPGVFAETIEFLVNGKHKQIIKIKGEGVPMLVELEDPS
jgi:hypothetical protein